MLKCWNVENIGILRFWNIEAITLLFNSKQLSQDVNISIFSTFQHFNISTFQQFQHFNIFLTTQFSTFQHSTFKGVHNCQCWQGCQHLCALGRMLNAENFNILKYWHLKMLGSWNLENVETLNCWNLEILNVLKSWHLENIQILKSWDVEVLKPQHRLRLVGAPPRKPSQFF